MGIFPLGVNDANFTIENIVKKNDIILIGSSMGAWISLIINLNQLKNRLKDFWE